LRNKVYADLRQKHRRDLEREQAQVTNFVQSIAKENIRQFDDFYSGLIVVPESVDSFECVNVLNYHGFMFQVEEDNVLRGLIRKEMGFSQQDDYPLLILDSSQESIPTVDLSSAQTILSYLKEQGFIGDFMAHSAKEKQATLEFLQEKVEPLFWELLRPLKAKLEFYSVPRHFEGFKIRTELSDFANSYKWRLFKSVYFYR
jgi:hypothetical protein